MSTLATVTVTCPACAAPATGEIAVVANLGRDPDLGRALRERRFNTIDCGCGGRVRIVRTVAAVDFDRRLWIVAYPAWAERHWRDLARAVAIQFDKTMRLGAAPGVRAEADGFRVRVVFGYEALRDKLVVADAGFEDVDVEVAKLALVSGRPAWALGRVSVEDARDDEVIWRVDAGEPVAVATPRRFVAEAIAPPGFLREELLADAFVSMRRWFVAPTPADPLAFDLTASAYAHVGGPLRTEVDATDEPITRGE